MPIGMFAVIAEALSDDFAFATAKAAQPDLLAGRDRYVLLDTVLFPDDRLAFGRAEECFGFQPQFNVASIAGQTSPVCFAIRIQPVTKGRRRLLFFGVNGYRSDPVTIGPPKKTDPGPDHTSTIYVGGGM